MRKEIVTCDKCGKDMTDGNQYYNNHLKFTLRYWQGGSMGGDEDESKFDIDLCEDCTRELSGNIRQWLREKKQNE